MKKSIVAILVLTLFVTSCSNKKSKADTFNFEGIWTRNFPLGKGKDSIATVYYRVWEDSIQYEMAGLMSIKYTIKKDTFLTKKNRWIGKVNDKNYVIFIKNLSKDTVTLLKKRVKNKSEALSMKFPSDTAKSRFSSWNVFVKK